MHHLFEVEGRTRTRPAPSGRESCPTRYRRISRTRSIYRA
jgi:hypothetical protein